mmetsp:Transcript_45975/g.73590  ORF Transcript_45975/g.73590 Transcript_45975/m.73590 type:complete len:250 (+) Transcript_45975:643-1392(+)
MRGYRHRRRQSRTGTLRDHRRQSNRVMVVLVVFRAVGGGVCCSATGPLAFQLLRLMLCLGRQRREFHRRLCCRLGGMRLGDGCLARGDGARPLGTRGSLGLGGGSVRGFPPSDGCARARLSDEVRLGEHRQPPRASSQQARFLRAPRRCQNRRGPRHCPPLQGNRGGPRQSPHFHRRRHPRSHRCIFVFLLARPAHARDDRKGWGGRDLPLLLPQLGLEPFTRWEVVQHIRKVGVCGHRRHRRRRHRGP